MAEYPRSQDYMTTRGQQALVKSITQDERVVAAQRVFAAYRHLAINADFQVVLDSWITRFVLVPLVTDDDKAKHNFVVTILTELRKTHEVPRL